MENNIKKIFDEILDYKFSKSMNAGYDPLEVDIFLDHIRSFLIKLDNNQKNLESLISQKNAENLDLKQMLSQKESIIKSLSTEVESLKKDGYQSHKLLSEMGRLQVQVDELKNEKNKK